MAVEYYPDELTRRSRALYLKIRDWGMRRPGVTLIGGWAVYELVQDGWGVFSRDIDLVLQSQEAFLDFSRRAGAWGLAWRTKGRTTFKDLRFRDDQSKEIVVDVFTTDTEIGASLFATEKGTNHKPEAHRQPFIPGLEFLIRDKIRTAPRRQGYADIEDKVVKDLVDLYHLVNYNREGKTPAQLRPAASREERASAARLAGDSIAKRPEYEQELRAIKRWLDS